MNQEVFLVGWKRQRKEGLQLLRKKREFFSDVGVDFPPHFRAMNFLSFGFVLIAVFERISSYFKFQFVYGHSLRKELAVPF